MAKTEPIKIPPAVQETEHAAGATAPTAVMPPALEVAMSPSAPTQLPPEAALAAEQAVTVWQDNKRIEATWCINENRNAWVAVTGVGWKKLANNSDSAIVALNKLAVHAKQVGAVVNYREEADGMIREMYVW